MDLIVAIIVNGIMGLGCLAALILSIVLRKKPDQDLARDMVSTALGAFESGYQRSASDAPWRVMTSTTMPDSRRINIGPDSPPQRGVYDPEEQDLPITPGASPQ